MAENDYKGRDYFSFALDYSWQIAEKTDFCVGLSATLYRMNYTFKSLQAGGRTDTSGYNESFGIFALPVSIKYHFWKFLYFHPGISFNYHPYQGYSWGMGAFAGVGAEYILNSGIAFSIAPEAKINLLSLGKTGNDDYNFSSGFDERLTQFGINIRHWIPLLKYCKLK